MTEATAPLLATEIERSILEVAGVTGLFRSGSAVSKLLEAGEELVGGQRRADPLVRVERTDEGVRVSASIGVRQTSSSVDVLRLAHREVATLLASFELPVASIELTVVHVNGAR
ncbi:hypothetical protein ACFSWE_03210 [Leucobacter albus]|uniref:Alkaline shock family protein YloU n=1 Tax=Leucobacter albus TaxID=272210 RepID=A0ABW3TNG5_9MICO